VNDEEDFEELRELRAEIQARHKKLVRALVGVGAALEIAAFVLFATIDLERRPGLVFIPVGLAGFGLAAIVRGLYSAFTDVDQRPDDDLVGVADPGDFEGEGDG
jgi:hypothetical protein